jgi:hypothetical protein
MVRPRLFLSLLAAAGLAATPAAAEIGLVYAYGQLTAMAEGSPSASDLFDNLPSWDGEVSSGDASSVRSYQSAAITNADGHLRATADCGVDVLVADGATIVLQGNSHIEIMFTTSTCTDYVLRGTLPAEGLVGLSGIPDSPDVTVSEPGEFELTGTFVAGQNYNLFFGVHGSVGLGPDLPGEHLGTLEFTLDEQGVVPAETIAWGDLHGAFR